MDSQPRWLDIEDELYPQITMLKQIIFENNQNGDITQFYTEIIYNSYKREIDLSSIIYKYFIENHSNTESISMKNQSYQIFILDRELEKLHLIGFFPHDNSYTLGEQFLSEEILYLIVKSQDKQKQLENDLNQLELEEKMAVSDYMEQKNLQLQKKQQQHECSAQSEKLSKQQAQASQSSYNPIKKRRTIQQVLKLVAQWRKLIVIKKYSSFQASQMIGISKRSLEDYFTMIKLGEKYGFDFDNKMKNGLSQLRNFVKQKHEAKGTVKVQILEKFKNMKK